MVVACEGSALVDKDLELVSVLEGHKEVAGEISADILEAQAEQVCVEFL